MHNATNKEFLKSDNGKAASPLSAISNLCVPVPTCIAYVEVIWRLYAEVSRGEIANNDDLWVL